MKAHKVRSQTALLITGLVLLMLSLSSCQRACSFHSHELKLVSSYNFDIDAASTLFADLRSDGNPLLITAHAQGDGSSVMLQNLRGKAISQINIPDGKISCLRSLTNPTDNIPWLFFSYAEGNMLHLRAARYTWQVPLKREMKSFEPYPRDDYLMGVKTYKWAPLLAPEILDDIDDDGRLDLVCMAADGFSANPRGLMVFDFETGALKWFFQTPCELTSLHFEDLDGDGTREFIFANFAHNNTAVSLNGLSDRSGHITVLDRYGRLVSQQKVFDGLGVAQLQIRDVDQDSILDIYAIISTQGANTDSDLILRLHYESAQLRRIKELNLPNTLQYNFVKNFLRRLDNSANYYLVVNDNQHGLRLYDKSLLDVTPRQALNIKTVFAIEDLKQKGYKAIIALSDRDEIVVLNHQFKELTRLENPFPEQQSMQLEVIDKGEGNERQIAISSEKGLQVYALDPIPLSSYIYRLFILYNPLILLILLIILFYVIMLSKGQLKSFIYSINQLGEGLILVSSKG